MKPPFSSGRKISCKNPICWVCSEHNHCIRQEFTSRNMMLQAISLFLFQRLHANAWLDAYFFRHPPPQRREGIYSLTNEPLEYHILQPIGQPPKKVSHGPLGPQLTLFNMEMETHKKHLEPKTRKTLHCQTCIPIGYVGPGFFVVSLVPQTRQEVCET